MPTLDQMDLASIRGAYCGCDDIAQRIVALKVTSQRDQRAIVQLGIHLTHIAVALRKVSEKLEAAR